ncbi:MAG: YhjD/YihY/BrkB family envelope integrity protein [Nitrospirales bacterium]|nr:YihY family inner membrane protein [Nitrospirales bacterium]
MELIERMIRYCQHDVWIVNVNELSGLHQRGVMLLRLLLVAVTEFQESILSIRATSLVYTTLLSLVPFLAVMLSVLKAFGVHQQIQPILAQALDPLGPKGAEITTNIVQFVDNLKVGVLGAVGLAGLFYTTYSLIEKIEEALNSIWRIEIGRPFARKITDYLSVVLVGPVFVFTAFGMTASAQSHWLVQTLMDIQPLGQVMIILTNLLPFFFMCFVFTFLYKFVPYTTVNLSSALVGGVTAGVFWQLAGMAFAAFVSSSGRYSAIYSSFAVLILFLIWLYVGWLIVLAGAQVAYYHQHPSAYLLHLRRKHQTPLFREYLTLALLRHITRRFLSGKAPLREEQLARVQGVPLTLVESLIHDLVKAGMVFRTDEPQGLVLARPPESISVAEVLRVVQHQPHNGPQSFSVGTDVMSQVLMRRDAAVEAALEGLTLRSLVKEQADASDQEQGNTFESASEGNDMSLAPPAMEEIGFPKPLQR